ESSSGPSLAKCGGLRAAPEDDCPARLSPPRLRQGGATSGVARRYPRLQRAQESDQVGVVLVRQMQVEYGVVEVDDVVERFRRTVVEERRPDCQVAQDGRLELADIEDVAGDQRSPWVGGLHVAGIAPARRGAGGAGGPQTVLRQHPHAIEQGLDPRVFT